MQADLKNKTALVTGASKGIGKATAIRLAEAGADVIVNARNQAAAIDVVNHIEGLGRRAIFEPADVTDFQAVKEMMRSSIDKFGTIDVLVASGAAVGISPPQLFHATDPSEYAGWIERHLFSRLYCVRALLDHAIAQRKGTIIMVTTDAGRWPTVNESLPGGPAAAVVLMTKVLAKELAQWNIRVNTVSTTVTQDNYMLEQALSEWPSAKTFRSAVEQQPFPLTNADVAEAVLFFASERSKAITGQILSVNGGLCFPG